MLEKYHSKAIYLIDRFFEVAVKFVPKIENEEANEMAQIPSGLKIPRKVYNRIITVEKISKSSNFRGWWAYSYFTCLGWW